jgi:hypothetical protein
MSSLNGKAKRSIKSNQLGMRELNIKYTGATGNVVSGPDFKMISSVTVNAVGNYTIILNGKAKATNGKDLFVKGHSMLTEDTVMFVEAVADDRVTIQCKTVAGADVDADFQLCIGAHDWKLEYE